MKFSETEVKAHDDVSTSCCPVCKKEFEVLLRHLSRKKFCKEHIDPKVYQYLKEESEKNRKENIKQNVAAWRGRNPEKAKESRNAAMAKMREENPEKAKESRRAEMGEMRIQRKQNRTVDFQWQQVESVKMN